MPKIPFSPATHFNPRPRKEGDPRNSTLSILNAISIHALVKRATPDCYAGQFFGGISIHALVKRATSGKHGCNDFFDISIHALVKRATH